MLLFAIFLWYYYYQVIPHGFPIIHLQTIIFIALSIDAFLAILSIKSLHKPIYSYNLFSNPFLVGAIIIGFALMIAAVHLPMLNNLLGTVPLTLGNWVLVLCIGLIDVVGIETVKWWYFQRPKKTALAV